MPLRRARADRRDESEVIDLRERLAPYVQDIDLTTGQLRSTDDGQPEPEEPPRPLRAPTPR